MNNRKNKVSIIMGVYNCEGTLKDSLESLLNQTYQNFDVVICDDGSTDRTFSLLERYYNDYPGKFILLKNDINKGLNYTLNKCLKRAEGEYIARMDGDDISLPMRLEKQVDFLDKNLDFEIVSSAMIYFDESGDWGVGQPEKVPEKRDFAKGSPFAHAPCMVRKVAFESVNGYTVEKKLLRVEDYHLWIKMYSKGFKGFNIQTPLYKMRDDKNAIKRRTAQSRINEAYVRLLAIKELKLSKINLIYVLRPLILILVPTGVYKRLHKFKLKE